MFRCCGYFARGESRLRLVELAGRLGRFVSRDLDLPRQCVFLEGAFLMFYDV